jgi:MFS transporter, DHA2 family, multidrug resistance protein
MSDAASRSAHSTLGGAVEVSRQLPTQAGEELLDAARDAFSQGMRVTAVVCAVVAAGVAVLVRHSLREHVDPAAAQAEITRDEALLATC